LNESISDGHLTDFERAGRITASVVGAILWIDPYHSRKWAWRVITGREPERASFDMARGKEFEKDAISCVESTLGVLCDDGRFVCHPTITWLGASPDAVFLQDNFEIPVEVKCPRKIHDFVPDMYYAQMQVQMQCMGAPYGYFGSWVDGKCWVTTVGRDEPWWSEKFPIIEEFYFEYVAKDIEPPRKLRK